MYVFVQKIYNGENGIQKYMCTLLAHFTEITLHTLLEYFKCNCLRRWCFRCIIIIFSFRSTFSHYVAFVNISRKHMYRAYFEINFAKTITLERWGMPKWIEGQTDNRKILGSNPTSSVSKLVHVLRSKED